MTGATHSPEYLSCAETAKLVRAQLRREFPGVKFSVRSSTYSGGASIDVSWVDGPTEAQVKPITDAYAGGRFDGMVDMKYGVVSWLNEDGTANLAHDVGTGGQKGSHPERLGDPTHGSARLVHFGADFVFTNRKVSDELVELCSRLASDNGRDDHGAPCPGCCSWAKGDRLWVARSVVRGSERVVFCCSQLCAGRVIARSVAGVRVAELLLAMGGES